MPKAYERQLTEDGFQKTSGPFWMPEPDGMEIEFWNDDPHGSNGTELVVLKRDGGEVAVYEEQFRESL